VLQRLIQNASREGRLHHPIDPSLACPVLQYADDTLIITRGNPASIAILKTILDDFSLAIGLQINFHKSTSVAMNVLDDDVALMEATLGCQPSSFPQTYLGLPLCPHKLCFSDYRPLLDTFDRYLSGWKAKMLSWKAKMLSLGGRLILVNVVLGGLAIYY
jgi:hypothetical protein